MPKCDKTCNRCGKEYLSVTRRNCVIQGCYGSLYKTRPKPQVFVEWIKTYLAEIGRKGGKRPSPHKKYETNAERQRAYRKRKKLKSGEANVTPTRSDRED